LTRLILVRHGETAHNLGNVTLGRADVPLNDRGRAQARAVAASLLRPPAAIYFSPLSRAAETARIIGTATGVTPEAEPGLIEMDVGEMEHLSGADLREKHPDFLRAWMSDACADVRMPGGETLREVQERAWATVLRLASGHPSGTVVAVTHNFVISMLVCRALDLPIEAFRRVGRPPVGSMCTIEIRETSSSVVRLNDISHLIAAGLSAEPGGAT
jgi:broad specificity phosphatase PhoE